jgi:hypothetical protein
MTDPGSPTTEPGQSILQSHVDDSPHRHATLKKKNSFNRGVSKASKADPTGSTTLSPTSPHADERRSDFSRSSLYCPVPTNADPTVVLAMRFQGTSFLARVLIFSMERCNQKFHQLFQICFIN